MGLTLWDCYIALAHRITGRGLEDIGDLATWQARRPQLAREFMRSMGLDPLPRRCDPMLTERGRIKCQGYQIVRLAYQIMPECWATACLYLPDPLPSGKLPAVLYACGHGPIGVLDYQRHASMWARRGYVCFIFDTIEQHDNTGEHHGLYLGLRPDWVSMGYTAAGGELWNSMRALDVLMSLPMVDGSRIGVTGLSGGGAHSFFLAVADERVRAAAPVCGVASPGYTLDHRHLMDHCDCLYPHNVFQRDISEFAALIAPRPLLFCFASDDLLFSQEEYRSLVEKTRKVYRLYGCEENCRLFEYPGPHGYSAQAISEINRWFDRHVSGQKHPDIGLTESTLPERELSVFNGAPPDPDRLDILAELVSPRGTVELPRDAAQWPAQRDAVIARLRREIFGALDRMGERFEVSVLGRWISGNRDVTRYRGHLGGAEIWIESWSPKAEVRDAIVAVANYDESVTTLYHRFTPLVAERALVRIEPRGTGSTSAGANCDLHFLRAGCITGLTPTMLMIQDLEAAMQFLRERPELAGKRIFLYGRRDAAVACLYHALFNPHVSGAILDDLPNSHREGGYILGILRVLDIEQAVGLLAPRPAGLVRVRSARRTWAVRAYERLGCQDKLVIAGGLAQVIEKVLAA